jgi:putative membrane protein insertion efficiency factor
MNRIVQFIFLWIIRIYKAMISPLLGSNCRFTPTCSEYGATAIKKYGPWKGGWMTIRRIGRCRPGGGSGWDPVP